MARDRVEPIGARRLDMLVALLCSVIAEPNRDRDKRSKPFVLSDFLIDWWAERDGEQGTQQTVEEQLAIVEMLNTAFGGRDLRTKGEVESDDAG